jgi:hypothetical protein
MTVRSVPIFLQAGSHPAEETRLALGSLQGTSTASFAGGVGASDRAHGVVNVSDFAVTQRAAGANMSVDVAAGNAWIRGTQATAQGAYHVYNDGTVNLSVASSDATNPRIDLVIARVQDSFYSGATNSASVTVVTGTPAASPTDPTLPANALVLARVRVPATSTSVVTANITDVRTRAASGSESYTRTGFKNAIMNGDFRINQRGFTSSTSSVYGFDRWSSFSSGGTVTYSAQTFTVGTSVGDYQPEKYARLVTSGQSAASDYGLLTQHIEDVRTFAGGTITVSFWAKAATSTLASPAKIAVELSQNFGSGGSPSSAVTTYAGQATLTTSWARYSLTVAVPSISGKTIGTTANTSSLSMNLWASAGSSLNSRTGTLGIQSNTFDIWGVQVERGGYATSFEERPLQAELAMCQRYYFRILGNSTNPNPTIGSGLFSNTATAEVLVKIPVTLRVVPTGSPAHANLRMTDYQSTMAISAISYEAIRNTPDLIKVTANLTTTSGTQYRPCVLEGTGSGTASFEISAEF